MFCLVKLCLSLLPNATQTLEQVVICRINLCSWPQLQEYGALCRRLLNYLTNCIMPFNSGLEITSFAKEALFAAAIVLKRKR